MWFYLVVITITLPAYATYDTAEDETITWTIPAASLTTRSTDLVVSTTFDITTTVTPSWSWVDAQISGMVAGEFKKINTNNFTDVALARTRANFDAGSVWANDAAVLTDIKSAVNANLTAFSGSSVNPETGQIMFHGGGHADSGDGSIFGFNPSDSLAWKLEHKSGMYDGSVHQVTTSISAITSGTPPRITIDDDIAKDGDQGVITGSTDANGTYQIVRISATQVDLYNVDGALGTQYTAFAGGSLTDSTGTLTIDVGVAPGGAGNHFVHPNTDGDFMPPSAHSYHPKWIGDARWLLSSTYVFKGAADQNRIWILDDEVVYRSYHDTDFTADGAALENGAYAYDTTLGRIYGFTPATVGGNFITYEWESGQGADSDFQKVISTATHATASGKEGSDATTMPQAGTPANRALFSIKSTTEFNYCLDLAGTPVMSLNTFSGSFFSTDMVSADVIGICYDDLNDEIIYWGGGATLGAITTSATLSAWTTAEITPVTPTGDLPVKADYPATATCAIVKIPDNDAYLMVQGSDVYIYLREVASGATQQLLSNLHRNQFKHILVR